MPEPTDQWVSVRDAAAALGLSEDAIRSKVKRRTLRARKGNDGRVLVLVGDQPIDRPPTIGRPLGDQPIDRPTAPTPEPRQSVTHAPETVPLSAHLATIEALQEAHREALTALRTDMEAERQRRDADHDAERQRHAAELARVESRHEAETARHRTELRINNGLALAVIAAGLSVLVLSEPWWRWW